MSFTPNMTNNDNDNTDNKINIQFNADIRNWFDSDTSNSKTETLNWFDRFSTDDQVELTTTVCECVDEYIKENADDMQSSTFAVDICSEITDLVMDTWKEGDICDDDDYDDVRDLVEQTYENYSDYMKIPNYCDSYNVYKLDELTYDDKLQLLRKITGLQNQTQPSQKTVEWYEFRHNLLSASNIWKAFGTQAQVNSLIYEKCKPIKEIIRDYSCVSMSNSLQWGIKYESVTMMIYEDMYQTKVGEFGCLQHRDHDFVGASPDGINVEHTNARFGHMVEIKNIVNREITGIPKKEYWIQTQMQMEVCELDKCDFVETRFKEYESDVAFYEDDTHEYKGVMLQFMNTQMTDGFPVFTYMPLSHDLTKDSIHSWIDEEKKMQSKDDNVLTSIIYWYLDEYSCVIIERNRKWYEAVLPKIKEVWEMILKERVEGYDHRAPKKRSPSIVVDTETGESQVLNENGEPTKRVCLVKLENIEDFDK
jgi:putative phage-type endonuclease|uniref:YqaJ viral recombinase domain-containing protein n=1 Tax=viral metagenome TaxID=1070528 RepID=A0A6C0IL06_9ZZZZ